MVVWLWQGRVLAHGAHLCNDVHSFLLHQTQLFTVLILLLNPLSLNPFTASPMAVAPPPPSPSLVFHEEQLQEQRCRHRL